MDKENQQGGEILNHIIRCTEARWEIEADPRHAELVVEQLGIEDRGVSTPGVSGFDDEDDVHTPGPEVSDFRFSC